GVYGLLALRMIPASHAAGSAVPELVSFVPVALVPTIVCLALALLWSRRVLAVACALALAVNSWWHIGYFTGSARVSSEATAAVASTNTTADSYARVMTCNTYNGQASAVDIVNLVREKHVEVLCLQELTDGMVDDLERAGIDELLPYHVVSAGASAISNGGRNGIWTAAPQDNVSRNLLPIDTSSMPAASIQVGDATVRIVSVHPNSPVRGAEDLWDEGLSVIGSLSDYGHAYLIMGDFNSAWDHARFRELLGTTFADAGQASGGGMHMTYPANKAIPALVEIDHIVYSKNSGIVVSSLETAQVSSTDHLALIATLEAL
ncbi:endonuclease/exonuclease/phosphatase family protein, partial [uncultured Parolsenella sp.]|uniref:endonuclease/exonuclease/phosphatase family protein n=1 Tax=uncultured Parolsenella sp. TaxID=2083008 RepID=UPI0025CBCD72